MIDAQEIRINNGYASKLVAEYKSGDDKTQDSEAKTRQYLMRTDRYLEKFANQFNVEGNTLSLSPPNCRFIKTYSNKATIAVIEEPPAMRSIRVSMDLSRDSESLKSKSQWNEFGYENFFKENPKRPYTFMLAIPYVIHILQFNGETFNKGRVFFRPKPLLGMSDILYRPPLLNINNDMSVCYGDSVYNGPKTSIASEIDHVLRIFWSSTFNPDYIDNYHKYNEIAGVCDYFTWQYYSQTNPMFIYSVDWIPTKKTIGNYIKMVESNNVPKGETLHFQSLVELFNKPEMSSKKVSVGSRGATRSLIYDICNGWFPEANLPVYIGDPLTYSKDRLAYIDCFIGVSGRSRPSYVRIKLDDKLVTLRINDKTKEFLADRVKQLRYESSVELPNKTILKTGDIMCMKNSFGNSIYKKVYYIRRTDDEKLELRIGSEYWFADKIDWDNVTKLDISNPEVDGIKIEKGKEYKYYIQAYYNAAPSGQFADVKFNEVTTGDNNSLIISFNGVADSFQKYNFSITTSAASPQKIYETSTLEELPKVFFVGRTLLNYYDQNGNTINVKKHKDFGLILSQYHQRNTSLLFSHICNELLSEDGQHFNAESNNIKINFSIEDKVIVADWENPLTILSLKTIKGFMKDERARTISFVLEDKHGTSSNVTYVDARRNTIMTGKIRKATNELNGVTIGTKIVAKQTGISCFPKKDVNIIAAFIVDTDGEPLVLCSNGCTLWFTDLMEKFELIEMKSPRWKKLNHAPLDPSKIKLQAGDIVNATGVYHNDQGYLVVKNNSSGGISFSILSRYHEFDEYSDVRRTFLSQLFLDCIPNPRMSNPKQRAKGFVSGFPTFHGGISVSAPRHSPYKFIDETGRF